MNCFQKIKQLKTLMQIEKKIEKTIKDTHKGCHSDNYEYKRYLLKGLSQQMGKPRRKGCNAVY